MLDYVNQERETGLTSLHHIYMRDMSAVTDTGRVHQQLHLVVYDQKMHAMYNTDHHYTEAALSYELFKLHPGPTANGLRTVQLVSIHM